MTEPRMSIVMTCPICATDYTGDHSCWQVEYEQLLREQVEITERLAEQAAADLERFRGWLA